MVTRAQVVSAARSWVGVPFRHMGRDRNGVDCVGLIVVVGRDLGLVWPDWTGNYTRRGSGFGLIQHVMASDAVQVQLKNAQDGDLIIMQEGAIPCHCGIRTSRQMGPLTVPHVVQAVGMPTVLRVVETRMEGEWKEKARFAFRLPGVED